MKLSAADQGKMGLMSMQERAAFIKAAFNIASVPEEGTSISLDIPLTELVI